MREWPVNASLLRTLPLSPSVTNFGLISVPKLSENRSALRPVRSRRLFSGFVTLGAFHLQSIYLTFLVEVMGFEPMASTLRTSGSRPFDHVLYRKIPGSNLSLPSALLRSTPLPSRSGHVGSRRRAISASGQRTGSRARRGRRRDKLTRALSRSTSVRKSPLKKLTDEPREAIDFALQGEMARI